jgi:hypothetical protein
MKQPLVIALLLAVETAKAASCCLGGSPKTFIQLRRLQTYEVGLSTSVRDNYARYDLHGEYQSSDGNQTYSVAWGAGARLSENVQVFGVLPLIHQVNRYGSKSASQTLPGDLVMGATWTAVEHLFFDDWYPTIAFTAGLKVPTGKREFLKVGRRVPGTGNGLWEPFVGASLRKDFEWVTVSLSVNYTRPFGLLEGGIRDGNRWEAVEAVSLPITRRFSIGGGAAQTWIGEKAQNGATLVDSYERSAGAFLTSTFFLTSLVDLTGTFDFSIPSDRLSVNYPAYRALTLTVKYGFY